MQAFSTNPAAAAPHFSSASFCPDRPLSQFYAHLYIGLYAEALGNKASALEHIKAAADERFAMGGYMHSVAKIHLARLLRGG